MRLERRMTIDEIAERLALSRTTVYHWVQELPIERDPVVASRAQRQATRAMQAKYRLAREAAYEEGRAGFAALARDPSFRDFLCLYLAEGYKRSRNQVAVCNSDAAIVQLCDRWLRRLSARTVRYSVQYHADQDLEELRRFDADAEHAMN